MYTLYQVRADEIDERLLQAIKTQFRGQTIEIAISGVPETAENETAYLLRDPANRQRLLDAMERAERGDLVTVDPDRLASET